MKSYLKKEMISIYPILQTQLPIKPFDIKDIEGLKGWIVTLVFLVVMLLIKEIMKLFSDRKKDQEMTLILKIMVEQQSFNSKIENHFATIANKYSKTNSDEQIGNISKISFDYMQKHLQIFQRKIIENNHIEENKDYVQSKLLEEIRNSLNYLSSVLDQFCTTKFKRASEYIEQEWIERIYETMFKNVFFYKDKQQMDENLDRIFKAIRYEYYEKIKEE